jgi:hypothetical protein
VYLFSKVMLSMPIEKSSTWYEKDRWRMQNHAAKIMKGHRISFCRRSPISKKENIKIVERNPVQDSKKRRFGFTGLQSCGCVHGCVMCSSSIALQREDEVRKACDWAKDKYVVAMLTITHPHQSFDLLRWQLDCLMGYKNDKGKRIRGAIYHFRNSKAWRNLKLVGDIRKFEATHGKNGWHPHHHIILMINPKEVKRISEIDLHEAWENACVKSGLEPPAIGYGLKLDIADNPSDIAGYIAKMGAWDFAKEMTKDQAKQSKKDGSTQWQILRKSMEGCKKSENLFIEYVECTKGVKSLTWSRGLKGLVDIDSSSDKEVADDLDAVRAIVYEFAGEQLCIKGRKAIEATGLELWYTVLSHGSRYVLLRCAEKGKPYIKRYLFTLISKHNLLHNMPYMQPSDIRETS